MTLVYTVAATVLFLTILAGLFRVVYGPDPADRMAAAQLIGTTGIALALLIGAAEDVDGAIDVAILLALLAALTVTAFTRLALAESLDDPGPQDSCGPQDKAGAP